MVNNGIIIRHTDNAYLILDYILTDYRIANDNRCIYEIIVLYMVLFPILNDV